MIGLIDLGLGNIKSVYNAFNFIGAKMHTLQSAEEIEMCDGLVLPGVGAFGKGCEALDAALLMEKIRSAVIDQGKPILGICLGMQLLACASEETQGKTGLCLIAGNSYLIRSSNKGLKVPHIGWNDTSIDSSCALFEGIVDPVFYFLHSYYVKVSDPEFVIATTNYGDEITVGFGFENVYGVQFHPEKSQEAGLQVLRNFSKIVDCSK